jgi:hypothetical protein
VRTTVDVRAATPCTRSPPHGRSAHTHSKSGIPSAPVEAVAPSSEVLHTPRKSVITGVEVEKEERREKSLLMGD